MAEPSATLASRFQNGCD